MNEALTHTGVLRELYNITKKAIELGKTSKTITKSHFIEKVWGQEEIICSRGKIMHLDKGAQCSLHFHKIKEEVFGCLSGEVRMRVGETEYIMATGDIVRIPIGTHHSFTGIQDSKIVEISYQDDDVNDSYRITQSRRGVL